jgi:hypothetical protein
MIANIPVLKRIFLRNEMKVEAEPRPLQKASDRQLHPQPSNDHNSKPSNKYLNMSSSLPLQIAETTQTASIKRSPSPAHDLNPSTAASQKEPVQYSRRPLVSDSSVEKYAYDEDDAIDEDDDEDIPYSVLKPKPRRPSFGPLPDLRFEQSYLASIAGADSRWKVLYITARDQVCLDILSNWNLE